jgi:hypothetical protein
MYDIEEIKAQLIDHIKSYVGTRAIVICPGAYNAVNQEWDVPKCNDAIESVYLYDWYVSFKICQLNPDGVFGFYDSADEHATDYAEYNGLSIEALYEILNYIEKQGIKMPHHLPKKRRTHPRLE